MSYFPSPLLPNCPVVADTPVCPLNRQLPLTSWLPDSHFSSGIRWACGFGEADPRTWNLICSQNMILWPVDTFASFSLVLWVWIIFIIVVRHYLLFSLCWYLPWYALIMQKQWWVKWLVSWHKSGKWHQIVLLAITFSLLSLTVKVKILKEFEHWY